MALLLMHGDAAFAGQGIVAERLGFSGLDRLPHRRHDPFRDQQPGGLHHPAAVRASRPIRRRSPRSVQAPILHVNGDDPEAVIHVSQASPPSSASTSSATSSWTCCATAASATTRRTSRCFTQPLMYDEIRQHHDGVRQSMPSGWRPRAWSTRASTWRNSTRQLCRAKLDRGARRRQGAVQAQQGRLARKADWGRFHRAPGETIAKGPRRPAVDLGRLIARSVMR